MPVNESQLATDLQEVFDLPPGDTAESATKIAEAIADNVSDGVPTSEAWKRPDFLNGWENYNEDVYYPAEYYKDPTGRVHLRGMIDSGTVPSAAFNLPAGYRPKKTVLFSTISNASVGRVDVSLSGNVVVQNPSNNNWVSLDGLSFLAEQ